MTPMSTSVLSRASAVWLESRKVATVLGIALFMASSFVAAYTVALGRPFLRHLPVAVVGTPREQLLGALQTRSHEYDLHTYPSRDSAIEAVDQQKVTAIIDASSAAPTLLLSSASDPSSARVLT